MTAKADARAAPMVRPRAVFAWCFFDWANSGFPTVITTFVFAAYFAKAVAVDEVAGTAMWGWAMSASMACVAVAGPVLGAIADQAGRRKPWIAFFTVLCAVSTAALWFVKPDPGYALFALIAFGFASFAFEMGMVFYNAMLPDLAAPARIGRISGWAWGLGYVGGLLCLVVALVAFVQPDPALFGLDKSNSEHIRACALLVAVWVCLFALPMFVWTPDRPSSSMSLAKAASDGVRTLGATLRRFRDHGPVLRFLIARMIFTDGLTTLFAFGGIYAVGTFGMTFEDLLIFGIAMNVTAGLGAGAFAWVDDKIGSKPTILIALCALFVLGLVLVLIESSFLFWVFGVPLGLFVGPAQAASRTMMAKMAPADIRTEMFGLYALSGKATAFIGPAVLAWATVTFDSQRAGMATVLIFFALGAILLLPVREPGRT